jgi:hypothetical protein
VLAKPPRKKGQKPWWSEYYSDARKIRDRQLCRLIQPSLACARFG